jgi:hypothetical protein
MQRRQDARPGIADNPLPNANEWDKPGFSPVLDRFRAYAKPCRDLFGGDERLIYREWIGRRD